VGAEGGRETLRRHGRKHFSDIGKRGFDALVNKWFMGDKDEAIKWLHGQQSERQVDRLLSERPAEGITCVEMPVFLDPDTDPFFDESSPSWRERVSCGGKGKGR
jgi:hypothetical protein